MTTGLSLRLTLLPKPVFMLPAIASWQKDVAESNRNGKLERYVYQSTSERSFLER